MKQHVIVTGVCGAIGSAIASRFTAAGYHVCGIDRSVGLRMPDCAELCQIDISNVEEYEKWLGDQLERPLAALINNAGISPNLELKLLTTADWDDVFAVNVRGAFIAIRELLPALSGGGAVVNISSVHAIATTSRMAAYASSKAALVGLTRAAALELASVDVRVNAILPGAIASEMLDAGFGRDSNPERARATLIGRTPLGRVGNPADVAEAVLFVADGQRSGFVTGQVLVVDGGATTRLATE